MASKARASTALFLAQNLLLFSIGNPQPTCSINTLQLDDCANLLGSVNVVLGSQKSSNCCTLLNGLADLDAAVCLCTALKANILGINLNIPLSLPLLHNACGNQLPSGFQCS